MHNFVDKLMLNLCDMKQQTIITPLNDMLNFPKGKKVTAVEITFLKNLFLAHGCELVKIHAQFCGHINVQCFAK